MLGVKYCFFRVGSKLAAFVRFFLDNRDGRQNLRSCGLRVATNAREGGEGQGRGKTQSFSIPVFAEGCGCKKRGCPRRRSLEQMSGQILFTSLPP